MKFVIVAILLLGALVGGLFLSLEPYIVNQVNLYLPKIFKTPASLQDVDLELLDTKVDIKGFTVANPPGFEQKELIVLNHLGINVNRDTLMSNRVEVDTVEFDGLKLHVGFQQGQLSLDVFQNQPEKSGTDGEFEGPEIFFRKVQVKNLQFVLSRTGESKTVDIPEFELDGILVEKDPVPPVARAFRKLFERVLKESFDKFKEQEVERLKGDVKDKVKEELSKGVDKLKDKLKSFF